MQEERHRKRVYFGISNLLLEIKACGETTEDNGIVTEQPVLLQNIRKEKFYFTRAQDWNVTQHLRVKVEKSCSEDSKNTNALEKHAWNET